MWFFKNIDAHCHFSSDNLLAKHSKSHKAYHGALFSLCKPAIVTSLLNRSTAIPFFGKDYHENFNTQEYLQQYSNSPLRLFALKKVHEFYQSYASTEAKLKILDIGSGPTIAYTISAAPFAAEIVLSEYTEANRAALLQWLNYDPDGFDWTHTFKHVVVDL